MREFVVPEGSFISFPARWAFDLSGDDLKRMTLLHFRFKYFADQAFNEGRDVRRCYYESQQCLCDLFGMAESSRSKVSKFLKKMEEAGYVSIIREKVMLYGSLKPRHYIVVNDSNLLARYGMTI